MPQVVKRQYVSRDGEWVEVPVGGGDTQPPTSLFHAARWVDGIPHFATPADRDAAYAAIGGPVEGMACFVGSVQQQQSFNHAGQWASFGNKAAFGLVQYGGAALTPGYGRIVLTPTAIYAAQGGITWASDNAGWEISSDGHYLVTFQAMFVGVPTGGTAQVLLGDRTVQELNAAGTVGHNVASGHAGSIVSTPVSRVGGAIVCPWYQAPAGSSMEHGRFSIFHISS